ncbi:uncharacterized protein LOC135344968 isoform X1 [Halichondria panicea]|uniref:uncharacterized protein LOC135344968 isoform X1 n=1 Tax=Halichondria panicea TaxID=6063 RepID=UPI00312B3033
MSTSLHRILNDPGCIDIDIEAALLTNQESNTGSLSENGTVTLENGKPQNETPQNETPPLSDDTPSTKRRRYTTSYSDVFRAEVAKYALEHGNSAAIRHFKNRLDLPESTVRSFKKKYLTVMEEQRQTGEVGTIVSVPAKTKGRKPGTPNRKPKIPKSILPWSTTGLEESMRVQPFDADRSSTVSLTGHLAIPAKLRCSKGNRTNETLILLQVAEPPMLAPSLLSSITDPPSPSHSHSSDDSSSSSPPTKRKRRPEANKTSEILLKILSEVSNKEKELDEEALFALQVAANLRRLSSRQKATAKIKIQQVLLEIEFPTET